MNAIALPESWREHAIVTRDVAIARDWFTDAELAEADAFRLPKRREEWMHARMAAKQLAVNRRLASHPREVLVTRVRFSLSHSHPYAAAAIGRGIDVQVIREISESAAHLFLSDEEAEAMRACSVEHRLLHFWCAKEAAWKAQRGEVPTLKQVPLKLIDIQPHGLRFDGVETLWTAAAAAVQRDVIIALTF